MTKYEQNRYPFNAGVAPLPGDEPMVFNEQCTQGEGAWNLSPGFFTAMPGMQNVPARYSRWDPQVLVPETIFPSAIDCRRGAWINQPPAPAPAGPTYSWFGYAQRLATEWAEDADSFQLQLFTRVGLGLQPVEAPFAAPGGYGGVIVSLESLESGADGPFIALGAREGENGLEASISKWSDSATLVDTYNVPAPAGSVFLRALLLVDPEDGCSVQYPEWSVDGFGWQLLAPELLLELPGNVSLTLGIAGTSYNDGIQPRTCVTFVDSLQVFGPYLDDAQLAYALRLKTQGGINWP
jgi:hypothetical protein